VRAGDDAADARWWPAEDPPALAFDHALILAAGLERLARKLETIASASRSAPPVFTPAQLAQAYAHLVGCEPQAIAPDVALLRAGLIEVHGSVPQRDGSVTPLYGFMPSYA
jgi:hypothetical protein